MPATEPSSTDVSAAHAAETAIGPAMTTTNAVQAIPQVNVGADAVSTTAAFAASRGTTADHARVAMSVMPPRVCAAPFCIALSFFFLSFFYINIFLHLPVNIRLLASTIICLA